MLALDTWAWASAPTVVTTPELAVVAVVWARPLDPLAVAVASACWPLAVAAVAVAVAAPIVEPPPPVA